jgi:lipoprotein-anchoring transpeptidase ErfK/SrfK
MRKKGILLTFVSICFFYSISAHANRVFVFDPNQHSWFAYENGELVGDGPASGGKNYCPDLGRSCRTPAGTYRVQAKRGANCVSSIFPLNKSQPRARMPYCSFFRGGYAIHGSNAVPGYNASHGCIRVHPEDARWLQQNFLSIGTTVIVKPYHQGQRKQYKRKHRVIEENW